MTRIVIAGLALLLGGCTQTMYTKDGGFTQAEFDADRNDCLTIMGYKGRFAYNNPDALGRTRLQLVSGRESLDDCLTLRKGYRHMSLLESQ